MDKFSVRPATGGDADDISRLAAVLTNAGCAKEAAPVLQKILDSEGQRVLVAVDDQNRVVGWAHVFIALRLGSPSFAEIGGMVVAQSYRRRGVGRLLLIEMEAWARSKNQEKVRVRCNIVREQTHSFYGDSGYCRAKNQLVFDKTLPIFASDAAHENSTSRR